MNASVASSNQADYASPCVITKPSGLAVGDLMIALVHADTGTPTTPSGWTLVKLADADTAVAIFGKIADSSDVAASNFSFATSGGNIAGALLRIIDHAPTDWNDASASATDNNDQTPELTFATVTPAYNNSLIIGIIGYDDCDPIGPQDVSSYGIDGGDPSSWTEVGDQTIVQSATTGAGFGAAYGLQVTATAFSNFVFSLSGSAGDPGDYALAVCVIRSRVDASATHTLLSADADFFTESGRGDTAGNATLLSADADFFDVDGRGDVMPTYTNTPKPTTSTVINTPKT